MKIFYHCDDYGLTLSITERIADAWEEGLLDGFSIMANGDGLDAGGARLRARPDRQARIAVHLNLFEGKASGDPDEVSLITDDRGRLNNSFIGLLIRWLGSSRARKKALLTEVEREWRAQIERVRTACAPRPITALDGHLHMHMLPFLFPVALKLAEEYGVSEIRVPREPLYLSPVWADSLSPVFAANLFKHLVLRVCAGRTGIALGSSPVSSTDAFIGILYTGRMSKASAAAGIERCRESAAGSVEVLFHIGRASPEEIRRRGDRSKTSAFPTSPMRDREYEALRALRG
jgi:predicted glycoside hydrolase/deacetylase ChbG (UPF0249 family)